jgi:hypothetical protein
VLEVERWAELRREHFVRGVPIRELVRRTGLARNTVKRALRSLALPGGGRGNTRMTYGVSCASLRCTCSSPVAQPAGSSASRRLERPDPRPALPRKEERVLARLWLTPTARSYGSGPCRDERISRERSSRHPGADERNGERLSEN